MAIKICFDGKLGKQLVAEFSDNEVFEACLPALTKLANRDGLKVITENTEQTFMPKAP
jgi:hypothetical protein